MPQNWNTVEQAAFRNISHDFTPDQVALLIVPHLTEEEWKQVALSAVQLEVEAMNREIDAFFDNLDHLPPQKMRQRFMLYLITDHQGDAAAAAIEFDWLMRPDYLDAIKMGLAPPPISRPWTTLLGIPRIFRKVQVFFRRAMKSNAETANAGLYR